MLLFLDPFSLFLLSRASLVLVRFDPFLASSLVLYSLIIFFSVISVSHLGLFFSCCLFQILCLSFLPHGRLFADWVEYYQRIYSGGRRESTQGIRRNDSAIHHQEISDLIQHVNLFVSDLTINFVISRCNKSCIFTGNRQVTSEATAEMFPKAPYSLRRCQPYLVSLICLISKTSTIQHNYSKSSQSGW